MLKTLEYNGDLDLERFTDEVPQYKKQAICHEVAINQHSDRHIEEHQHSLGMEAEYTSTYRHPDARHVSRDLRVRIAWEFVEEGLNEDPELENYELFDSDDLCSIFTEIIDCPYCGQSAFELETDRHDHYEQNELEVCKHYVGQDTDGSDDVYMDNDQITNLLHDFRKAIKSKRYSDSISDLLDKTEIDYECCSFDEDEYYNYYFVKNPDTFYYDLAESIQNLKVERILAKTMKVTGQTDEENVRLFSHRSKFETIFIDPKQTTLDKYLGISKTTGDEAIIPVYFDVLPFLDFKSPILEAIREKVVILNQSKNCCKYSKDRQQYAVKYQGFIDELKNKTRLIAIKLGYIEY